MVTRERPKSRRKGRWRYFQSLFAELQGQVDQLENLIGFAHMGELGQSREFVLRAFLRRHLPSRLAVSTGFILFYSEDADDDPAADPMTASPQLDIVVWDRTSHAPMLEQGEFAVVPASAVELIIEVKTSLDSTNLRRACDQLMRVSVLYDKHRDFEGYDDVETPGLMVVAWRIASTSSGSPTLDGVKCATIVRESVRHAYEAEVESEPDTYLMPISSVIVPGYLSAKIAIKYSKRSRTEELGYIGFDQDESGGDAGVASLLGTFARMRSDDNAAHWYEPVEFGVEQKQLRRRWVGLAAGEEVEDFDPEAYHEPNDAEEE